MRFLKTLSLASTTFFASITFANADINVVTSIKPVHSLVSGVMEGVATPDLIIDTGGSPHTYSLKPSQARQLQNADIVFWISPKLEAFLEKPIESIATNALVLQLLETEGLLKVNFREGGAFDSHEHEHDEHDEHDEQDEHDKHDEHDEQDQHDKHDEHHADETDPHIWLDPLNAAILVSHIADALSDSDPDNKQTYEANADAMLAKLDQLVDDVTKELKPVQDREYIVFHDAYQYFERRFNVSAIGSITVSPEVLPGADRIRVLQEKVASLDASCVFSEPQFEPRLVSTITENTNAGTGVLDPLGSSIENGPDLYFQLIRDMSSSLKECLASD